MIGSYQEQRALDEEREEPEGASFAYIGTVYRDGVTLVWEQTKPESRKRYKVNRSIVFHAGDYVRVLRDSGTYVVEYPVGEPIFELIADKAAVASKALTADRAALADKATTAATADNATKAAMADTAATAYVAEGLESNDNTKDRIRLTFNQSKSTFAVLSEIYTSTWRDFAQK